MSCPLWNGGGGRGREEPLWSSNGPSVKVLSTRLKGKGGSGGGCGEGRSEDMKKQVLHVVVVVIVAPYCVGDAQNYVHFLAHNSCEMRKLCRWLGLTYVRTRCASMKSLWEKDVELPP